MKTQPKTSIGLSLFSITLLLAGLSGPLAQAQQIFKNADGTDPLISGLSWTGGVAPGPNNIAVWSTGAFTTNNLGGSPNWLGIQILTPGFPVTIPNDGNTLTNGTVGVVGNVGIDMSGASQNLTLSNNIVVNGVQNWNVASGQTLTLGGNLLRNAGGVIRFGLPGGATVMITNGSAVVNPNSGVANAVLGSTYGFIYFGTVNDVDFAALTGTPNSFQIVPGSSIGGLYGSNPSGATPSDVGGTNVMIFNNTASYGDRLANTRAYDAMLFNTLQSSTAVTYNGVPAWQVNIPSGRTLTINNILVTTNVGSSPVLFNNGAFSGGTTGFVRIGNGGTQDLLIYQNNPAAPLIFQPNIVISQQGGGDLVKMGAGTVQIQNAATYTNGTVVYEGTLEVDNAVGFTGGIGVGPLSVFGGNFAQSSGQTNSAPATIFTGAMNSIVINAANGQAVDRSNLTFNAGTTLQLVYSNSLAPAAVPALFVTNSVLASPLTANGTVTVNVLSGSLSVGQFPLVMYSGSIGGVGGSAFALGTIEPHSAGYLSNNVANNSIDLVVTNITQPIKWAAGNATWDIGLTANWDDNTGAPTTYQQIGPLADNVIFDDTASGTSPITVTLNTNPIPNSATVNNTSKTYTLSGNGGIGGLGSVTKMGTGTLFLQTTNTFTGGLNVNGGILNFTSITNLGNGGIKFGGGTLQYASGTVDDISARPVTFNAGGGTIDLNGNAVTFANPIGNNGAGGFTLTGNNTLQINGTNNYSGNTVINVGSTLAFQTANTYLNNSAALVVNGTLNAEADTALTLNTSTNQILAGTGIVQGEIAMGSSTTITPATNGTVGTLTINGDLTINGGTLAMDIVGSSGSSRDLLAINNSGFGNGNLTLGSGVNAGTIALNITGTALANGTYPLITYSGSLSGAAGFLNLTGFSQSGQLAYLSSSASANGAIDLIVLSGNTNNDVWVGGLNNNAWDLGTTANWITNGVSGGTYADGNTVTFDDSGNASQPVGLKTTLLPGSITLNVTNNNYTFQDGSGTGAGLLVGTTGLKINGPTLPAVNVTTLLTPNVNSGPTILNGSGTTLQVGNGSTTGDIGSGPVTDNGTLVFDQTDNRLVLGQISGTGTLIQEGSAVLALAANNTYTGPTIISNANSTLQVGTGGAAGSLGTGAVTDNGLLAFDRSGSITVTNVSGSGSVSFVGGPTITLASGLSYLGSTLVTNGSLTLAAANRIPNGSTVSGNTGILGLGGTLNLNGFNQTVNGLSDVGGSTYGFITNSAAITNGVNVLTIGVPSVNTSNTFSGLIADAGITNKARIQLLLNGPGIVTLAGTNTYSGGTIVGLGQLSLGASTAQPGTVAAGPGGILLSNGTTLNLGGNDVTFPTNLITIAPNSTVTLTSANLSDAYEGGLTGDAVSTNIIAGPVTMRGNQWMAFPGTVLIGPTYEVRCYDTPAGGTNTTFDLEGTGFLQTRTTEYIFTGALVGNGSISAPNVALNTGNIVIGTKNVNCTFIGSISGPNNIYKSGTGTVTLDGATNNFTTIINPDGSISTNYFATNGLTYVGATTVSNGVLAIVAPANLIGTNFTSFTLAASTAVLDLSSAGYSPDGTNYVTNSVLTLVAPQTVNGIGTIRGSVVAGSGTTVSVGFQPNTNGSPVAGALTITNSVELGGVVNMNLSGTNAPNSSEIVSPGIIIDGTATLVVTNVGPGLYTGSTFTLFSQPVSGFASVTLPATDPTGTTNYVWNNNLAVNGTIQLASGGLVAINPNPTNITFSISGGNLNLSWPADHTGWFLQAQTNSLTTGLGTNWVNVAGANLTNQVVFPINNTNGAVFYRMVYP